MNIINDFTGTLRSIWSDVKFSRALWTCDDVNWLKVASSSPSFSNNWERCSPHTHTTHNIIDNMLILTVLNLLLKHLSKFRIYFSVSFCVPALCYKHNLNARSTLENTILMVGFLLRWLYTVSLYIGSNVISHTVQQFNHILSHS